MIFSSFNNLLNCIKCHNNNIQSSSLDESSARLMTNIIIIIIIIIMIIIIIIIIIIMIIIICISKEDNVFSMIASLPYGPLVNIDTDYYRTFFQSSIVL